MTQPPNEPSDQNPQYGRPQPGRQPGQQPGQQPGPQLGQQSGGSQQPPSYGQQPQYGQQPYPQQTPSYGQQPQYGQQYGQQYPPQQPTEQYGQWQPQYPPHYPDQYAQQPPRQQGVTLSLGARSRRRPVPRAGAALAGAGAGLLLIGALIWTGVYFGEGVSESIGDGPPDTGRRFLGFVVFLALAVVGYVVLVVRRNGPLATAGTVLAAGAVPLALIFVTLDVGSGEFVNTDAVVLVSILIWLATYLFVPGARGRSAFLTAAVIAIPVYIVFKVIGDDLARLGVGFFVPTSFGEDAGTDGLTTAGTITLIFGLVYYALAALFDRRSRSGVSTAFVIGGYIATSIGISLLTVDFGTVGSGVVQVIVGLVLAVYGGWAARRFTTWIWSLTVIVGVVTILVGALPDNGTAAGIVAMIVGAALAAAAVLLAAAGGERPDLDPTDDRADSTDPVGGGAPAAA